MAEDGGVKRISSSARPGSALCLAAGLAFALQPVVVAATVGDGSPIPLLAWRYLLAGVVLVLLVRRSVRDLGIRTGAAAVGLGALAFALDAGLFYTSLSRIPVPLASLVHYAHLPLVVGGAALASRRRPGRRHALAVGLVIAGVALVSGGAQGLDVVGVALALASALAYAAYMLLSARLLAGASPLPVAGLMLSGAGVSLLGLSAVVASPFAIGGTTGAAAIVETSLVGSVVAVGAFYLGLERVGAGRASILLAIDVPIGIAASALVLGERLGVVQMLGAMLVVAAIAGLQVPGRRRPVPAAVRQAAAEPAG